MKFSGLVRVGILGALVTTFISGIVAYYAPEAKAQAAIGGVSAPKWLLWTFGLSVGGVAYFSAVFWTLGQMRKNGEDLGWSDGFRALFVAPFVVVLSPLIFLGGAVAEIANHPGELRNRLREIYACNLRSKVIPTAEERVQTCPECGEEAKHLATAGVANCKKCGMVSL